MGGSKRTKMERGLRRAKEGRDRGEGGAKKRKKWTVDWIEGCCTMVYTGMIGMENERDNGRETRTIRDEKKEGKREEGWDTMMEESRIKGHHCNASVVYAHYFS